MDPSIVSLRVSLRYDMVLSPSVCSVLTMLHQETAAASLVLLNLGGGSSVCDRAPRRGSGRLSLQVFYRKGNAHGKDAVRRGGYTL